MADAKITGLTADTSPTSDDLIPTVTDPAGTPANRKVTLANAITKAHGLSDGLLKVATGTMAVATAGTDYSTPSSTDTLTNKTFDADGAGNSITNIENADIKAGAAIAVNKLAALTASELVVTDASGFLASATGVSATEAGYLSGVTSDIQTQLNAKQASGATLSSLEGLTLGAGDMLYATAADTLTDLAIGTASQQLRVNAGGTAPEWFTPSASGGQTLVDIIVAPSGGDYTTLAGALAAATTGQTIFIRSGTYTEAGSITGITTTNLTIIGESRETTIIDMGAYTLTMSGAGLMITNLTIKNSAGQVNLTGASKNVQMCTFRCAGGTNNTRLLGADSTISNNYFVSTGTTGYKVFDFGNISNCVVSNNYFYLTRNASAASYGALHFAGQYGIVTGNMIVCAQVTATTRAVVGLESDVLFSNNYILQLAGYGQAIYSVNSGILGPNITSNVISGAGDKAIYNAGTYANISNNSIYVATDVSADHGIYNTSNYCTMSGNIIYGGGTSATAAIYTSGNACIINGNATYRFSVGVKIDAASNTIVTGNSIVSSTTPISDTGYGTISGSNYGHGASVLPTTKDHVSMKNTSGGAMSEGQVVVWKPAAAGNEITTTTTAGDDKVMGIMIDGPANNAFGKVQTLGKTTVLKVNGTTAIAIGDPLTTYTSAGIAAKATAGDMVFAYALEAYSTADSNGVIDALLISPRLI